LRTLEKNIETCFYQVQVRHKHFPDLLNVVVIVKTNLTTGKSANVLLFSDDLDLACDKLVDYYQLRFQIEFNFRDAKRKRLAQPPKALSSALISSRFFQKTTHTPTRTS